MRKRIKNRVKRKIKKVNNKKLSLQEYRIKLCGWIGWMKYFVLCNLSINFPLTFNESYVLLTRHFINKHIDEIYRNKLYK